MQKKKIFIGTSGFNLELPEIKHFINAGFEIESNPYGRRLNEQEISSFLQDDAVIGLIAGLEPLSERVLQHTRTLKAISRCGAGLDNIDLEAAKKRGIAIANTPDGPTNAVAELTLGLMLAALRAIPFQDRLIRAGQWERPMGELLEACTVGLIGYGRIGRKVATLASAFGCKILIYDPHANIPVGNSAIKSESLDGLLKQCNVISLHVPYSQATHHIIGASEIEKMKQGAILVNTSRGGLVDENALKSALEEGHLGGAALDVFEDEPYCGPLRDLNNVVLSAHTGSYARQTREKQEAQAVINLLEMLGIRTI